MSKEIEIPLFPLNVVLFPNSKLPLFIFEERYKKMINECFDNETCFGINFFNERKMKLIGCTAWVEEVVNRLENGEMNIVIKGVQRYKIINYELSLHGFYTGKIEYLYEDNLDFDKAKMEKCVKIYNDLVELVYKGTIKKIDLNDMKWFGGKRSVAFSIAEKCGLSLSERQSLLEMDFEDRRLDLILKYFEEVVPKLKDADRISTIIKGDGYIQ
ncbi:MAG: LON peptidase substrate-binding domain-containing protein [Bacteroidota bacterium]|nr:LON peptidase substrate-binding domain-containing protein [Bacteroidota bacterium]